MSTGKTLNFIMSFLKAEFPKVFADLCAFICLTDKITYALI